MNARIQSLSILLNACWLDLQLASQQRDHPWRMLALATVDGDGADVRTVVLREVDIESGVLRFFTDARSPKVAQLRRHPAATLMCWNPDRGWQLRMKVSVEVETDGLAVTSRWVRLKNTPAAFDYLSPLPPGTPVERFEPQRAGREHFALVQARVQRIDWLELHADGHRRAVFDAQGQGQWVVP